MAAGDIPVIPDASKMRAGIHVRPGEGSSEFHSTISLFGNDIVDLRTDRSGIIREAGRD
jgi:hypothetical protein